MVDEVVGRGIIEVVGDATQFSAAMAQVAQAAGLVEKKLIDTAESIGTNFKQAEDATTSATTKIDGSIKRFIASVEREIATLSLSRDSYRAWEAQVKGIPESVYTPYINKLNEARAAQEQAAKALKDQAAAELQLAAAKRDSDRTAASQEQFLANLREQVALYGRTTDEVLEYRAAQAGVLAQATPMISQLRAQRAAQEQAAQAAKDEAQAQREAAAAKAGRDNFLTSLKAQSDAIGKTRSQLLEMQAAQMGLTSQAAPYIAKLREQEGALIRGGKAYNEYGQTVKQTNAALRQVPAQITDIVVSLQGGTAPLTVLLQQGGQLRDVFGGIAPAAKALGAAVIGLINPYTLAAAAAGALAYGYLRGSREADEFRKAIAQTGNAAGVAVGELASYARAIDGVVSTQGAASEALVQFITTGRVSRENLQQFTTTALQAQKFLGTAVADTVKQYAALAKDPVEATRKLSEETGGVTVAIFEQIRALKDQGREIESANLAQKQFNETQARVASDVEKNLRPVERAWISIKSSILDAADALLTFGRQQDEFARLDALNLKLSKPNEPLVAGSAALSRNTRAQDERDREDLIRTTADIKRGTVAQGEYTKAQQRGIEASTRISDALAKGATNSVKLSLALEKNKRDLDELRRANPNSENLSPAKIAELDRITREQFKDKKGPKPRAYTDDAATRRLQQLRETEASLRLELSTTEKLVGAQRDLAEFNQLIADLKEKRILTAEQKSLLAAQDQIRAQLDTNVALQKRLQLREEEAKVAKQNAEDIAKLEQRAAQIQASTDAANARRREQYDDRLAVFGKGSEAREQLASQIAISREFARFEDQLRKGTKPELYDSDLYKKAQADIKASLEQAQADNARYYEAIKRNQGDWQNGSLEALQNYVDNAANISSKLEDVFTKAFKGAEDALLQFVRTGKLDFKSLADSIISDLVRIAIQQQITKPLAEGLMSGMTSGSGFGGLVGSALGAFFGSGMNIDTSGIGITSAGSSLASMGLGGGRAIGGPVSPGRAYEVGENGPELLNWQGRQFLLPGNGMGNVEAKPQGAAAPMNVTNQFYISGPVDRRTQTQLAAEAGRGVQRALARNN